MQPNNSKRNTILAVLILVVIIIAIFWYKSSREVVPVIPAPVEVATGPNHTVIGKSVQGRNIDSYTYGDGDKHILLVGGIHGGYEWNTVLLAYSMMDYFDGTPDFIPAGLSVTIIPSMNPDGVFTVTGKGRFVSADVSTSTKVLASGRFNANEVDVNRNFDCKWQPKSTWQSKTVSAGTAAFSEPEALALKNYISEFSPDLVVFWHSKAGGVYASACKDGILPRTMELVDVYAKAAGYHAVKTFDAYAITGAADDWMASIGIPAFSVELATHENIEWAKNLAGVKAVLGDFVK
jgi:Zinc carboxypeptidase